MVKIIFRITLIICTNLLAFLSVWLILDALFKTDGQLIRVSVVLSLPVLGVIMYLKAGKIMQDLHTLSPKYDRKPSNDE